MLPLLTFGRLKQDPRPALDPAMIFKLDVAPAALLAGFPTTAVAAAVAAVVTAAAAAAEATAEVEVALAVAAATVAPAVAPAAGTLSD